ncbi:MAG TPA: hypothetical protein VF101_06685 [Gaiellaceae bacterium]
MLADLMGAHTAEELTAIGTCVIAAFAVVALFSLRDARRTRHASLLTDLSGRWDDPLAVGSREAGGEYDSAALVALVDRTYSPPPKATEQERRANADALFRLAASLNLMEMIGALWIGGSVSTSVIQRMWGATFEAEWTRWEAAIRRMRELEHDPGVYSNFERTAWKMRRCLRIEMRRRTRRRWRLWWRATDWLRR